MIIKKTYFEKLYNDEIISMMRKKYNIINPHQVPKIEKIVVNMRFSKVKDDEKAIEAGMKELALVSGFKPAYAKAKKSISTFKTKIGDILGARTTLRKKNMYYFLEKFINVALPRTRDFKGFKLSSLDKNYNLICGVSDILIFPELGYDDIHKSRGLDVNIVTSGLTSKEMALEFFRAFRIPLHEN